MSKLIVAENVKGEVSEILARGYAVCRNGSIIAASQYRDNDYLGDPQEVDPEAFNSTDLRYFATRLIYDHRDGRHGSGIREDAEIITADLEDAKLYATHNEGFFLFGDTGKIKVYDITTGEIIFEGKPYKNNEERENAKLTAGQTDRDNIRAAKREATRKEQEEEAERIRNMTPHELLQRDVKLILKNGHAVIRDGQIVAATFDDTLATFLGEYKKVDPTEFDDIDFQYLQVRNNFDPDGSIAWQTPYAVTIHRQDAMMAGRILGLDVFQTGVYDINDKATDYRTSGN